jgi:hypothetical protein
MPPIHATRFTTFPSPNCRLGPAMQSLARIHLFVALFLLLGVPDVSLAQDHEGLSVHRICVQGGTGEKLFLRYWSPAVNTGLPEPVCVFKAPEFGGLPIRSLRVLREPSAGGAMVAVEFDDSARTWIEKMSRANVGNIVAVVVSGRIVSMPMITRPYSDNKLLIVVASEEEATRLVAALTPFVAAVKK